VEVRIASYNVNSVRVRLPIVLPWVIDNKVDVLCLQETKVRDADFPAGAFDDIDYNCIFRGQKSYNGVAILSKYPISNAVFGFPEEPKDEVRMIRADINGITIVNTYVPQGHSPNSERFRYKLKWFSRLLQYFQDNFSPSAPVLWTGDLNIAPKPIDVYDPETLLGHVCFHPDVHKGLNEILRWGFADVFREHCTKANEFTFWDYRLRNSFKRNLGWRLDHIMATPALAEKSSSCYIDKRPRAAERPSDHTPIVAEFNR
jgi:exodeoxyribonuclease-3